MKRTKCIPDKWSSVQSLHCREIGLGNVNKIRNYANGSRTFLSRLEQSSSLDYHQGCVNAVNFNSNGTLIASGSDDLKVAIWDWIKYPQKPVLSYASGHTGNVFQTKFMPYTNDNVIVSCARDGQVRVGYISNAGQFQETKKIAQHRGSAHKLSVEGSSPYMFKTAGEDGVVYNVDLREPRHSKLFTLHNEKGSKVALYSIDINPVNEFQFAVSGRDQWSRIFDTRKITDTLENGAVKRFCPDSLKEKKTEEFSFNVTCLMYNYSGTELLCSYNDEEIYLFDLSLSSESNFTNVYKGHRNSETVKGVNFIGPYSEYVISGSDCGHIFIWNKETEEIVTFVEGDSGVVNVLEPHPNSCILATAGLDHDVKIWQPTGEPFKRDKEFTEQLKSNAEAREQDRTQSSGDQIIYLMLRHLTRQRRRQRERLQTSSADTTLNTTVSDMSDDDVDDDNSSESEDWSADEDNDSSNCVQS